MQEKITKLQFTVKFDVYQYTRYTSSTAESESKISKTAKSKISIGWHAVH